MKTLEPFLLRQVQRWPNVSRRLRLRHRYRRALTSAHPDWTPYLEREPELWERALARSRRGRRILLATGVGAHPVTTRVESFLGVALTLRGANVSVMLCDSTLPACLACNVQWYPRERQFIDHGPTRDLCKHCYQPAAEMYASLGFRVYRFSDFLTPHDRANASTIASSVPPSALASFHYEQAAVGEHAQAGALRFFARGSLEHEPNAEPVQRRYLHAAILTALATRRLLESDEFTCTTFDHGIYVPNGIVGEVCRNAGVRVVNWAPAYRKNRFIFSHGDTYHRTLMTEPTSEWENIGWSQDLERALLRYLKSRWYGTEDWIQVHSKPRTDMRWIRGHLGVDFSRPCVGLLTNVVWDAQVSYPANVFRDMKEWVLTTMSYFAKRPDLQLLIRVHPAEVYGQMPSRQPIDTEIRSAFPALPRNVFIIPPDSPVSTYAVLEQCNAALVYATKAGVELTSLGIPTIVAGEAWIRNKGVTLDPRSKDEYFELLSRLPLPERLDRATTERARKYAFHFFFRRMIPIDSIVPSNVDAPLVMKINGLHDLMPGRSRGLDIICDGILRGTAFVFPAEDLIERTKGVANAVTVLA